MSEPLTNEQIYAAKKAYELLGIAFNASQEEIEIAYKKLVKRYHPDKFQDEAIKEMASEKMKRINCARDFLREYIKYINCERAAQDNIRRDNNTSSRANQFTQTCPNCKQEYPFFSDSCPHCKEGAIIIKCHQCKREFDTYDYDDCPFCGADPYKYDFPQQKEGGCLRVIIFFICFFVLLVFLINLFGQGATMNIFYLAVVLLVAFNIYRSYSRK